MQDRNSPQISSVLTDQLVNHEVQTPSRYSLEGEVHLTPLQKLIDKVGGQGRYQFLSFMIFSAMWFVTSWTLMGIGFFFDDRYQCYEIDNKLQCQQFICSLDQTQRIDAMKWHADSIVFTFQNQLFICENAYLKPILISLLYVGSLIGFFIIPYIADNWGRRTGMMISWTICAVGIMLILIADSSMMIGFGQFFTGFGINPAVTLCYSFLNEQVLGSKRQSYGLIIQVVLAIGQCTIAIVFLPDYGWQAVCFILFGMIFIIWISMFYLVESPKFLISKSKKKTLTALNDIALKNGKQPLKLSQVQAIPTIDDEHIEGVSVIFLIKYKSLRWTTISGGFIFLALQLIYYTTLLSLDNIGFTPVINQQIVGVSQALSYVAVGIFIHKMKRKKWALIGMLVSSLMCFVLAVLTIFSGKQVHLLMKIAQIMSLIINRFVLCGVWGMFYIYISELYPTKVRSMGVGFVSGMGTIGSILTSYMLYETEKLNINQWLLPGILGLVGFCFVFCLKETFKKPMSDDIEEIKQLGKWDISDDDAEQYDQGQQFEKG